VRQIGVEKHRMLDLFMQVPTLVRTRLSKRCKELYEVMLRMMGAGDEAGEGEGPQQVRSPPGHGYSW
jgi:hypothetical protein